MFRLKFLFVYAVPICVIWSFNLNGYWTFFPTLFFFLLVPVLELFIQPDRENFDKKLAYDEQHEAIYDWMMYTAVPVQLGTLCYFFYVMSNTPFGSVEFFGRTNSMGLMCGILGINVGHELGHRKSRLDQFWGELLLLTSLNTHFLPFHNFGHHRHVATPKDPATAKKNQSLFNFWFTSHFGSYKQAWQIENNRMKSLGRGQFSLRNRMVQYSIMNFLVLFSILLFLGWSVLVAFLFAAVKGIVLLETINYIEHYGLTRTQKPCGRFERVRPMHSWNSDHPIGRAMLFNLSRHSDHHYNGSKPYQLLDSYADSPQMPTGYPGMVCLALLQPLWFEIMNKRLEQMGF